MQVVSRVTLHPAAGVTLRPAPVRHCRPPVVQRAARTQRGSTRLSKCRVRCFVSTDQQRNVDTLEAASKAPEDAAAASPTQQPVNSASEVGSLLMNLAQQSGSDQCLPYQCGSVPVSPWPAHAYMYRSMHKPRWQRTEVLLLSKCLLAVSMLETEVSRFMCVCFLQCTCMIVANRYVAA